MRTRIQIHNTRSVLSYISPFHSHLTPSLRNENSRNTLALKKKTRAGVSPLAVARVLVNAHSVSII